MQPLKHSPDHSALYLIGGALEGYVADNSILKYDINADTWVTLSATTSHAGSVSIETVEHLGQVGAKEKPNSTVQRN